LINLLWIIGLVLLVLWLLGFIISPFMGGFNSYFTRHCNYFVNYLVGAANKSKKVKTPADINRLRCYIKYLFSDYTDEMQINGN
jgi:hypothetical protein